MLELRRALESLVPSKEARTAWLRISMRYCTCGRRLKMFGNQREDRI